MRSPAPLPEPPLLAHDAALVRDLGRVEQLAVRPVLENRERLVDDARRVGRNRQDVDRLVEARVGVQVGAEPHTDRLQVLHEIVLVEMRRAVERHVLDEVREAELVLVLEHRAGVHDEPQLGALFRLVIDADVVADAVRQRADLDLGIDRQRRGCRRRGREAGRGFGLLCANGAKAASETSAAVARRRMGGCWTWTNVTRSKRSRCPRTLSDSAIRCRFTPPVARVDADSRPNTAPNSYEDRDRDATSSRESYNRLTSCWLQPVLLFGKPNRARRGSGLARRASTSRPLGRRSSSARSTAVAATPARR